MHIYTRTGDNGETGVIGGRLSKTSTLFDLVGGLDELNASIGVVVSSLLLREIDSESKKQQEKEKTKSRATEEGSKDKSIEKDIDVLIKDLLTIQSHIFELGTLAVTLKGEIKFKGWKEYAADLEKQINRYEGELPSLKNFILPGGTLASSYLHLSRSICRRTERQGFKYLGEIKKGKLLERKSAQKDQKKMESLTLSAEYIKQLESALKFLNRLSDYLFILARIVNYKSNTPEQVWRS